MTPPPRHCIMNCNINTCAFSMVYFVGPYSFQALQVARLTEQQLPGPQSLKPSLESQAHCFQGLGGRSDCPPPDFWWLAGSLWCLTVLRLVVPLPSSVPGLPPVCVSVNSLLYVTIFQPTAPVMFQGLPHPLFRNPAYKSGGRETTHPQWRLL